MISRLFAYMESLTVETDESGIIDEDAVHLAAAALMLEVARSDNSKQTIELQAIEAILTGELNLEADKVGRLLTAANESVEDAHDLYQFTQLINDSFDASQKIELIYFMWLVAFADGHVEAIEDHIIRRVAGLLHVDHGAFIQMKLEARDRTAR